MNWIDYRQILTHYYTGIHIRDANGASLTPPYRWNATVVDMPDDPAVYQPGSYVDVSITAQNTGNEPWQSEFELPGVPSPDPVALSYRIHKLNGACVANCLGTVRYILPGTQSVDPGDTHVFDVDLFIPAHLVPGGQYVVRWDMRRLSQTATTTADQPAEPQSPEDLASAVFWFSEQAQPWFTQDEPICVEDCRMYLPAIMKNYAPCDLIEDGSFEQGSAAWVETGHGVRTLNQARTGEYSFGFQSAGSGSVYQTVTVPGTTDVASLSFWWYMRDIESSDELQARIRDGQGNLLQTLQTITAGAGPEDTWNSSSFDVTQYARQTIRVAFEATNSGIPDFFYIDDVTLTACP